MSGQTLFPEHGPSRTLWSGPEVVFAAAASALALGVFVPAPELMLDILWVCVLSLTIAVSLIFPAAAGTSDLKGFAALLSVPALLRIALVSAMCVRLFSARPAGLLIPAAGRLLTGTWPLAAALVCLALAAMLAMALFTACQRITAAAERYKKRLFPLKCIGIETDLKMGVIAAPQAQLLAQKVQTEARLFSNLTGTALLMRIEAAVEIAAILACLVAPFLRPADSAADQIARASSAAVGLAIFSLVPAVISAMAGAHLAGKDSLTLRTAPAETAAGRIFTLIHKDTGQTEEVELLNPDFVTHTEASSNTPTEERIAEFEPEAPAPLMETMKITAASPQAYYRQLALHVAGTLSAPTAVLFTAPAVEHLPVTVFVNTALGLLHEGRKLLLIDADTQRSALAQVFEADTARLKEAIQPTGFDGLSLYAVSADTHTANTTLTAAMNEFSAILIYAPDAAVYPQLEKALTGIPTTAFVFGLTEPDQTRRAADTLRFCRQLYLVPTLKA